MPRQIYSASRNPLLMDRSVKRGPGQLDPGTEELVEPGSTPIYDSSGWRFRR